MPSFQFIVDVTVEKTSGKFASKEELEEAITEAIADANPQSISGENGGEYEVTDWDINSTG